MSHSEDDLANPFSAPLTDVGKCSQPTGAMEDDRVVLRNISAGREAQVGLVSLVYLFPILLMIPGTINSTIARYRQAIDGLEVIPPLLGALLYSFVVLWVWSGFRRLRRWAYWITVVLSLGTLMLVEFFVLEMYRSAPARENLNVARAIFAAFLVGQAPGGVLLFLLPSSTRSLFSVRYRDLIGRTPQVKPRLGARTFLILAAVIAFDVALFFVYSVVVFDSMVPA